MADKFFHFSQNNKSVEEEKFSKEIENQIEQHIKNMIDNEDSNSILRIEIPENLSDKEAMQFIDAVLKRLGYDKF